MLLQQFDGLSGQHAVGTAAVGDNVLIAGEFRESFF
jgi:hypothetical protein